jgi:Zn-dependent protease with chaperone function
MIGFYLLALTISAVLVFAVYAEARYAHRIHLKLALFCLGGTAIIIWSIIPRPDKFVAPGPRLEEQSHPRLFGELRRTAKRTGQAMPKEVYLVPDVNAWVSQRGGVMGIGSRRIMGVGLALMQVLTVRELRAVIAHEFGHYHGGDTKLGPWIYTTRAAIGRTLTQLTDNSKLLTAPFRAYGNLFLRITHSISRQQEYAADALAVRTEGAEAMASSLIKTHRAGMLFSSYWQGEVAGVLHAGFRPPIAAGFGEFMGTVERENLLDEDALKQSAEAEDPYDTHPSLARRLEALKEAPSVPANASHSGTPGGGSDLQSNIDAQPAIKLVGDSDTLESMMLSSLDSRPSDQQAKLAPIDWDEVGARVYTPMLKETVRDNESVIRDATFRALNKDVIESWGKSLASSSGDTNEEGLREAVRIVESATLLALIGRGWDLWVRIGRPLGVTRGGKEILPRSTIRDLAAGRLSASEWQTWCSELEIADVGLVPSDLRTKAQEAAA